jgi:carboxyl-terminal processing protease
MRFWIRAGIFLAIHSGLAFGLQAGNPSNASNADPIAYLNRALDLIQARALRRDAVDWPRVRAEALSRARTAKSTADTYDAIRFVLASLGDHHSSFHPNPALQGTNSAQNTDSTQSGGKSFSPYVGRYEPEGHLEMRQGKQFGLLVVPKCFPAQERDFVAFETKLQKIIAQLDAAHPSGWIVDLRGNVGGNMWPMLAGVGPLLGGGDDVGEFFDTEGHAIWQYQDGVAAQLENGKVDAYPAIEGPAYHVTGNPKVAVLIDRSTGSSGEAIAIAFRGRPRTRYFGEHTTGVSTVNVDLNLSDGATIWLTVGVQADRTGRQYPEGIAPDEAFPSATEAIAASKDPVVQAAEDWLGATD